MDAWHLTADEHGIMAMADLHRAGLEAPDIVRLVRDDSITSLARGWYAMGRPTSDEARHILTTRAMLRAHEGRAVAGHHSALLLLDLPTYRPDLTTVRLSRRTSGSPRTREGQRLGRAVPADGQLDLTVVPALAVVQHGISAGSLAALVAADGFLRHGGAAEDLITALEWVRYHPRTSSLRRTLDHADGRHESPGETVLGHLLRAMDLPVTPQVEITATGFRAVVDFLVDGEGVVIEFDGKVKYMRSALDADPFGNRRSASEVVWAEKRREDRIRELDLDIVRVIWSDFDDPKELERRIRAAIARARRRRSLRSA